MMNAWRVRSFFRAVGLWESSAVVLARTHGHAFNLLPLVNTKADILTRSLMVCSRVCPPLKSSPTPIMSASHAYPLVGTGLLNPKSLCVCTTRGKGRKAGKKGTQKQEERDKDDTDDEEEDMRLESGADFRDIRARVPSLRMDAILKAGLNMSRNKVEAAFYASKIRINGKKFLKKSHQCHEGDEVDVMKAVSNQNPNNLYVSRVVIMAVGIVDEDDEEVIVKLRRYPNLLIECYEDYKAPEQEE